MNAIALTCLLASLAAGADPHAGNGAWLNLCNHGIQLSGEKRWTLPAPTLSDGQTPAQQEKVVASVVGSAYPLSRFLRASAVAPHILHQQLITDGSSPVRVVDAWFVAHGSLDALADRGLIDRVLNTDDDSDVATSGNELTAAMLAERGIDLAGDEAFAQGAFRLWKRVEVQAVLHSHGTQSEESVLVAAAIDNRFDRDAQFPNQWRSLSLDAAGQVVGGEAHTYSGLGMYLKATRLAQPAGALFVEWHLAFVEPLEWFDGANLIGAKLPAIVQSRVRALRRELALAATAGDSTAGPPAPR